MDTRFISLNSDTVYKIYEDILTEYYNLFTDFCTKANEFLGGFSNTNRVFKKKNYTTDPQYRLMVPWGSTDHLLGTTGLYLTSKNCFFFQCNRRRKKNSIHISISRNRYFSFHWNFSNFKHFYMIFTKKSEYQMYTITKSVENIGYIKNIKMKDRFLGIETIKITIE